MAGRENTQRFLFNPWYFFSPPKLANPGTGHGNLWVVKLSVQNKSFHAPDVQQENVTCSHPLEIETETNVEKVFMGLVLH